MANQTALPKHWNKEMQYEYRKHASEPNAQKLIDILHECVEIIRSAKPLPAPYARKGQIIQKTAVLRYILTKERGMDLQLANEVYKLLEDEMKKMGI